MSNGKDASVMHNEQMNNGRLSHGIIIGFHINLLHVAMCLFSFLLHGSSGTAAILEAQQQNDKTTYRHTRMNMQIRPVYVSTEI